PQEGVESSIKCATHAKPQQLSSIDAFEKIRPSVEHVQAFTEEDEKEGKDPKSSGKDKDKPVKEEGKRLGNVGTGVVIVDTGIIMTNLHVVNGAKSIKVTFSDGLESEAAVTSGRPEHRHAGR